MGQETQEISVGLCLEASEGERHMRIAWMSGSGEEYVAQEIIVVGGLEEVVGRAGGTVDY